ncbi:MAG: DUF1501 domain-containing protein [Proteobacteria bacterium]|nr:DUF1501 domain-containing protein [Pseudomonadota bacterium]
MHRRQFIRQLAWAGGLSTFPGFAGPLLAQSSYSGKLLLTLQLDGGVDVTSFCDPKMNVLGEPEINRWARTDEIRSAGNISYAPYADNQRFFDKYFADMLVINGVDAQTNSHSVGIVNNWSGRNSDGFPSLTAIMAASNAPELPLAYLNFGGFGNTQSIIRSSRIDDVSQIENIIFPNVVQNGGGSTYRRQSDWERIQRLQMQNMERLAQASGIPAGNRRNRQFYQDALLRAEGIKVFGDLIPPADEIQQRRELSASFSSNLHQQIQVCLLAFKSGVAITADLFDGGYDTHEDHDTDHPILLANSTDAIDYLWTYAEELGLADRIVLVIGSDFGRTPFFNSGDGKDHWPIGSTIIMEKNAAFTNRVIGETDGGHNTLPINPQTLAQDNVNGVIIQPAHVHKALRRYLGIHNNSISSQFPFNNTEDFDFFG